MSVLGASVFDIETRHPDVVAITAATPGLTGLIPVPHPALPGIAPGS
jgi:hypothetical protein